jgi:single-strand DNA-binding protein
VGNQNYVKEQHGKFLNRVFLMGRLTRDVEVRYTPKGVAVAEISLAINRYRTDDAGNKSEEVTFVSVTLWARLAEIAAQYLSKGKTCMIDGRLQLDTWDDRQTGQKQSRLRVIGENLQLLESRQDNEAAASNPPRPSGPARPGSSAPATREPVGEPPDIPGDW